MVRQRNATSNAKLSRVGTWLLRCTPACLLGSTAWLLRTGLGDAAFAAAADHCDAHPPLAQQVVLGGSYRGVTVCRLPCQACGLLSRTGYGEAPQTLS